MEIFRWNWDPWDELRRLRREAGDLLGYRSFGEVPEREPRLPVNVHQDDEAVTVTAELPGVRPEDLEVRFERDRLKIAAERKEAGGAGPERYHRHERWTGRLERELLLPAGLDPEKIAADLADGILTLRLPKAEVAKPRKIEVKTS